MKVLRMSAMRLRCSSYQAAGESDAVALLPIGVSPVSSVGFESSLKPGVRVRKGDVMGHFLLGGSDFVMVFQAGYRFALESP